MLPILGKKNGGKNGKSFNHQPFNYFPRILTRINGTRKTCVTY